MTQQLKYIINKARRSKILHFSYHIVFWIIVGFFYFLIFNWNSDFPEVSIIFTVGLLPIAFITACVFNYFLIPQYLDRKRYGYFISLSLFTLLVSTWLSFLIVFYALIHILNTEASLDPAVLHPELQVLSLNFIVFFAIAVKQIKRAFVMQQEKNDLVKAQLTTQLKLREAELKLLKAQVQPHFLFNTLNNLYGLTLEKSDDAPKLVLQLSEILDYVLYRCNTPQVLLEKDLNNLKNYLNIEKIRYSEKLDLKTEFPEDVGKLKIAPLILLPYVENAFKHGVNHFPGNAYVNMSVSIHGKDLNFHIKNMRNPLLKKGEDKSDGIGMANVQRRLDLLYASRYNLEIEEKDETFSVSLTLKLED